jgi:hypothetical protein
MELRLCARKTIGALSQIVQGAKRSTDLEKLVTVCAWSRKIKVDGRWVTFEEFLVDNLGVSITHGIDPETAQKLHGQLNLHPTRKG